MLSVNISRMSTNCPDRILATSFWGKGSVAGDRENAAVAVGSGGEVTRVCIAGGRPAPKVDGGRDQTVLVSGGSRGGGAHTDPTPAGAVVVATTGTEVMAAGGGKAPRVAEVEDCPVYIIMSKPP